MSAPSSRSDRPRPVVILGGGLAGLSSAYHLARHPFVLVERQSRVGGHARSHRREGHTFDVTGHWLHLRDPRITALVGELFDEDAFVEIERRTMVHSHGVDLAYPFQANLHGLPLEVVEECLVGFFRAMVDAAGGGPEPATFDAFAAARFGKGIARHFFVPYNRKLWGGAYDRLTPRWVDRYIPFPEPEQIVAGAIGLRQEGLGYNARFRYPRAGGIDALPTAIAGALDRRASGEIRTGTDVEEVDPAGRRIKLSGAPDWLEYHALVSTIPLPELIARIPTAPPSVREAAALLRWVGWRYLDVATRVPARADYHWVYVPETRFPFFRVGVYSNAVASMAPTGCSSLYVELAEREREPDIQAIARGLVEIGALGHQDDLKFAQVRDVEYAYVVFDDAHEWATATIFAWLAEQGIRSCGRYGAWVYNSMEDSMLHGLEAAAWAEAQ